MPKVTPRFSPGTAGTLRKVFVGLGTLLITLGGTSLLAACGSVAGSASPAAVTAQMSPAATAAQPAACLSGTCYVAVSVATVWVKPWYPRSIDKPALGNPAHPGMWVRSLTVAQKIWLVGKLETQALYGAKVVVTGHWRTWTHVAIPSQPTNRDRRGYPGWVPTIQLTRTAPPGAKTSAVVRTGASWLWSSWTANGVAGRKLMLASYDTSLPVARATPTYVEVTMIGGRKAAVRRSDVALHVAGASWGATRAKVVAEARKFLGLAYLWAGTSGFGFDCSGFTYSVYRAYGVTLPRDADRQAVHGTPVARSALQPGDLVFFRGSSSGPISHVGMYVGGGKMIDAPNSESAVRIESVWWSSYAGARRYLSR